MVVARLRARSASQLPWAYMLFILLLSEEELLGCPPSVLVCIQYARPGSAAQLCPLLASDWREVILSEAKEIRLLSLGEMRTVQNTRSSLTSVCSLRALPCRA